MNQAEAKDWIAQQITMGTVDPKTLNNTCREVVTRFERSALDRDVIQQALTNVLSDPGFPLAEHFENAAYLTVNLENLDALEVLADRAGSADRLDVDNIVLAIAAIRTFRSLGSRIDRFRAYLFSLLSSGSLANLAFEALSDIFPNDTGAYFCALSYYHSDHPEVVERALTHLYYRGGDTKEGSSRLKRLILSQSAVLTAIRHNTLLPAEVTNLIAEHAQQAKPPSEGDTASGNCFSLLSQTDWDRAEDTQRIVCESGLWASKAA